MDKIGYYIANYAVNHGYIGTADIEETRFGIEVILSQGITFFPMIMYGVITNQNTETMMFLIVFCMLRVLSNGYHCKKFSNCFILTNIIYLIVLEFCDVLNLLGSFKLLIPVVTFIMMLAYHNGRKTVFKDKLFIFGLTLVCSISFILAHTPSMNEIFIILIVIDLLTFRFKQ